MGKDCKEYQEDLKIAAVNDKNAKKDKDALDVCDFFLFRSNRLINVWLMIQKFFLFRNLSPPKRPCTVRAVIENFNKFQS